MVKEVTYINTLDGRVAVEWWDKEDFRGRVSAIYGEEAANAFIQGVPVRELIPDQVIPIPDTTIVCDFCNVRIEEFPVPVVWNHALCGKCFKNIQTEGDEDGGS